jgi:hypothetical protein
MWALIINIVYEQACRSYLASVARHHRRWV